MHLVTNIMLLPTLPGCYGIITKNELKEKTLYVEGPVQAVAHTGSLKKEDKKHLQNR